MYIVQRFEWLGMNVRVDSEAFIAFKLMDHGCEDAQGIMLFLLHGIIDFNFTQLPTINVFLSTS